MTTRLVGREDERRVLDDLLDAVDDGVGRACVLRGEPGMGKTRLLEYATEARPDVPTVWVTGVEAEKDLDYAALHRLLRRFLPLSAQLPEPQRDALGAAFGLQMDEPPDRFLVGLACLTLLADVAAKEGLICVIDDAQWIDEESLAVLAFVGRRLSADRMALLFGLRDTETPGVALAGLPTISVRGLPDEAALALLGTQVDVLDGDVARRIVVATSGCPLALVELASELTEGQLRGGGVVSEPLPIGRRLEAHFHRQVLDLSPGAQRFLLVSAAETSGNLELVRRVAAQIGAGAQAEDDATATGLLATTPKIMFRHPLIRSAVYAGAQAELRRTVHTALAAHIDAETDPDRRAQHRAAAARGPDELLAQELEQAAERARRRGGYSAESSFLLQAGELTPDARPRAIRLLRAAEAALTAGLLHRAESILEQARTGLEDRVLQAEALRIDGRLRIPLAQPSIAMGLLLDAARAFAPTNVPRARDVLLEAVDAGFVSGQFTFAAWHDVAHLALTTSPPDPIDRTFTDVLLDGAAFVYTADYDRAAPLLREAAESLARGPLRGEDIVSKFSFGLFVTNELWDDQGYERWARVVEEFAREQGALLALQYALLACATLETRAGRFAAAEACYNDTVEITRAIGGFPEFYAMLEVDLHAWRGNESETVRLANQLSAAATAVGAGGPVLIAHRALAILALSDGRYSDALEVLRPVVDQNVPQWTCQSLSLAVEAAARSGDLALAARWLEQLRERATAAGTPWALGQLTQSQAIVASGNEAEALFLEAIAHFERTTVRTELAYAHLHYGEWLRRQNRKQDAGKQLGIANDRFSAMGAHGFARRAQIELAATGANVRRQSVETQNDMTPQEAQVARLAATGATNAEIATRMFISSNTVDYHLRKVYRKLGVTSRRQLASIELVSKSENAP